MNEKDDPLYNMFAVLRKMCVLVIIGVVLFAVMVLIYMENPFYLGNTLYQWCNEHGYDAYEIGKSDGKMEYAICVRTGTEPYKIKEVCRNENTWSWC